MSELWRWVDQRVELVRLDDLRGYLNRHGWRHKPFGQPQVLLYEESVSGTEPPRVQLLPASESSREFRRSVIEIITSLSAVEDRHPVAILEEMLESRQGNGAANPKHLTSPATTSKSGSAVSSES